MLAELKHFVVVDDNEGLLQIWRRVLGLEKYCSAYLTSYPKQALEEIQTRGADVLITDLMMPEMNGIELLKKAKKQVPDLRVFLSTTCINNFDKIQAWTERAEVLRKPYSNIHQLQLFIHHLVHGHPLLGHPYEEQGEILVWNL